MSCVYLSVLEALAVKYESYNVNLHHSRKSEQPMAYSKTIRSGMVALLEWRRHSTRHIILYFWHKKIWLAPRLFALFSTNNKRRRGCCVRSFVRTYYLLPVLYYHNYCLYYHAAVCFYLFLSLATTLDCTLLLSGYAEEKNNKKLNSSTSPMPHNVNCPQNVPYPPQTQPRMCPRRQPCRPLCSASGSRTPWHLPRRLTPFDVHQIITTDVVLLLCYYYRLPVCCVLCLDSEVWSLGNTQTLASTQTLSWATPCNAA